MNWLDDYDQLYWDAWHSVWCTGTIALPWPRHITSRWTTAPRGKSLPLPLPRSWLGVGGPTPRHLHTHRTH